MLYNIRRLVAITTLACALLVGSQALSPARQEDELTALYKQGLALYNAGRYSEAIPLAERYLGILEKWVGPDHPDVAQRHLRQHGGS